MITSNMNHPIIINQYCCCYDTIWILIPNMSLIGGYMLSHILQVLGIMIHIGTPENHQSSHGMIGWVNLYIFLPLVT